MLTKLSHIMIYAKNHAATVAWYQENLGFEIDYHAPGEYCSLHHRLLGRLAIHKSESEPSGKNQPLPYFQCNDIHATLAEMKSKGIKVSEPRREGESPWFADFQDNAGNWWGIEEH